MDLLEADPQGNPGPTIHTQTVPGVEFINGKATVKFDIPRSILSRTDANKIAFAKVTGTAQICPGGAFTPSKPKVSFTSG